MRFVTAFALLAAIVLLAGNGLYSQEKKEPPKTKGILPANWGKIDLSAEQKAQIYKVQAKYKEDINKLKEEIKKVEAEERQEMAKVLTPEQKKKLLELATGEGTTDPKKDKDKK